MSDYDFIYYLINEFHISFDYAKNIFDQLKDNDSIDYAKSRITTYATLEDFLDEVL